MLVTFEIAKKLKELGYDKETYWYYDTSNNNILSNDCVLKNFNLEEKCISTPCVDSALGFLKEKYNIEGDSTSFYDFRIGTRWQWWYKSKNKEHIYKSARSFRNCISASIALLEELIKYVEK